MAYTDQKGLPFRKKYSPDNYSINPVFSAWQGHIEDNLKERNGFVHLRKIHEKHSRTDIDDITYYRYGPYKELYEACLEHADRHNKEITSEDILLLIHPLMLHLSMYSRLGEKKKDQADLYMEQLWNTIRKTEMQTIVLDTAHHYAAATSSLLEQGSIDAVFFTQYDSGWLMDDNCLSDLADRRFFVGGCFNELCLQRPIILLEDMKRGNGDKNEGVYAISDLVMNHVSSRTLVPKKIRAGDTFFKEDQIVGSDSLYC